MIAADPPYYREVLAAEPDAGSLVADADPVVWVVWAKAIGAFVSRPLEIRQRAALRLAERYSWDSVVVSLVEALAAASSRA